MPGSVGKASNKTKQWFKDHFQGNSVYPGQNGQRWNQSPFVGLTYNRPSPPPPGSVQQPQSTHHHQIHFRPKPPSAPPNPDTQCQVKIASVTFLGDVYSTTTYVKRDLGFQGRLGPYVLLSYGDTMFSDPSYSDHWRGMTSNSVAFATHDPLVVVDPLVGNNGFPEQWLKCNSDWGEEPSTWAVGITNVVETSPGSGEGIVYYLLNHRPKDENNLIGAGIARISLNHNHAPHHVNPSPATVDPYQQPPPYSPAPTAFPPQQFQYSSQPPVNSLNTLPKPFAQRVSQYIWSGDHEPWFGDVCSFVHTHCPEDLTTTTSSPAITRSAKDRTYIYTYGHKKDNPWVYLARVRAHQALDISAYEYWHGPRSRGGGGGGGWSPTRLDDRIMKVSEEQSVFWQVNQGQVIWNPHLRKFLFVYCDNFWSSKILLRHSSCPEGPWSESLDVQSVEPIRPGGTIYAAVPHDYFDPEGKTLVVSFTNHPNRVQAVEVRFA